MRRITVFEQLSADGYFAAADGNLDWVVPDPEMDMGAAQGSQAADTMLFGRKTYEQFKSFWPNALDGKDPHGNKHGSPELKAIARWINDAKKIVFSRTLTDPGWKNVRVVRDFDPRAVRGLKEESGKDIMVFGSGSIVEQLTEHGLVDDYMFLVSPVLLGSGQSLLRKVTKRVRLELEEAKAHSAGNVLIRYSVAR